MISKYENSEENCKTSYIFCVCVYVCVFFFFFFFFFFVDNSIYSNSFFLLNFVWFKFLNDLVEQNF